MPALLAVLAAAAQVATPFLGHGPYDPGISTPEQALGYGPGKRHTTYFDQQRYLETLRHQAPDRVKMIEFGHSTEGRPLRIMVVSSPDNMAKLDQLREANLNLAKGQGDPKTVKPIVWVNETIHGNESASFESAMWLLYNLVASKSPAIEKARGEAITIVNPCYNPDGHERFVVWYNSVATGNGDQNAFEFGEPRIVHGRTNHYRFDMNRDRVAMSQMETRAESQEFFRWQPHVYVDQHSTVGTYFFPPTALATNVNVDRARYGKWTEAFGRATAKAFDERGYDYFVKETFDFYMPGYMDTFATLHGAIGMTHETDATYLRRKAQDGSERTLETGMAKHLTSALAVIGAAVEKRESLVSDFAAFRKSFIEGKAVGAFRHYGVFAPTSLQSIRFQHQLKALGVRFKSVYGEAKLEGAKSLWPKGDAPGRGYWTLIDLAQPAGAMAKALLEPESDFEREFVDDQMKLADRTGTSGDFYDLTGWALPFLHSLPAYRSGKEIAVTGMIAPVEVPQRSSVGYAMLPGMEGSMAAYRLMKLGVRMVFSPEPCVLGGKTYPKGTMFALGQRNPELSLIPLTALESCIPLETIFPSEGKQSPGSDNIEVLRQANVALLCGTMDSPAQFGHAWWVLENQLGVKASMVSSSATRNPDRFTCIVAPGGSGDLSSLKDWVSKGNCLVLLGTSPTFMELETKSAKHPIPGSLFMAEVNPDAWVGWGLPKRLAVPVDSGSFRKVSADSAVAIPAEGESYLTGWVWPDSKDAVKGTTFCQVESVGSGYVVWFAEDPTNRAMTPGLLGLLMNALVLGARY